MADTAVNPSPAETLETEKATRGRAAIAAWLAAVTTLAGAILSGIAFGNLPDYDDRVVSINDALGLLATGGEIPAGRAAAQLQYIGEHPLDYLVGPLLSAAGGLLMFFVLAYLFRATRARTQALGLLALIAIAAGAVSYAVGTAVVGVMRVVEGSNLAPGATNSDSLDAIGSGPIVAGTIIQLLGSLSLGFAFVLVCLHAMRAGLLTRFIGTLGMIAGATFVLPLDQQGIIRSFWLGAVGFLIAGRWPSEVPAWKTGRAEPWPSAREARMAGRPAPAPDTPAPTPRPDDGLTQGQRRKKRKKS
jgi:hypothetical protein